MKKSRFLGAACACISMFMAPQAMSTTIDTYFGWNYVDSVVENFPTTIPELYLNSITYIGESGTTTQNMDFGGPGVAMPDGVGLAVKPTNTYSSGGDGESTRTQASSLPIDWIPAGSSTSWGSTYAFPTIGITGITVQGVPGLILGSGQYVVGLIPFGANTELDSSLGGFQSDIYDSGRVVVFTADPLSGITGQGAFIFSAASVVPVPAAMWLFGSGLIGLIGVARRKKS